MLFANGHGPVSHERCDHGSIYRITAVLSDALLPRPSMTAPAHPPYHN